MQKAKDIRKINPKSLILPELIPLIIPDFLNHSKPVLANVLSFEKISSEEWFMKFVNEVEGKIGKEYFPIMRMSDGEYTFLLGIIYPYLQGHGLISYAKKIINVTKQKLFNRNQFNAATLPGVSSGNYQIEEIKNQKKIICKQIKKISDRGILALHLTYAIKPFQEHYHYPLMKWLNNSEIELNDNNYYPFYFVYALLRGQYKKRILANRKILIFHSAQGEKRNRIIESLQNEGVKSVMWHEISSNRSMFDKIELQKEYYDSEIAFIGAGVGKFNIISQLEPLNIPCIDVGFVFEVWANEENKWKRPIMVPDWEWEDEKVNFIKK
ncbi:MAG: hypothetical protein JJE55_12760 [Flavobacteriaceae bacterium]|nr:hypothetical protein [Flavobacteriaceae bacterium]